MKACIRWCCPCCLRGEPEEKSRVQVAYATSKSPYNDENVNLLKPDELPENTGKENEEATVKPSRDDSSESSHSDKEDADSDDMEVIDENGTRVRRVVTKTVTTTSTKTSSDNGEPKHLTRETLQMEGGQAGGDTDDKSEVMEYVDENGRRVRRIVKKTITTTSSKTSSDNGEPKHLTRETLQMEGGQGGGDTDDNSEVMEYVDENGRVRRIVKKTITTTSTKTSSDNGEPKHLTLQIEGGQAGGDTDDNSEVMEYVDENGRRVRRIVKKTITTTSTKTSSDNGEPKHLTLQIEGGQAGGDTDDNSEVMEYVDENGRRVRRIVKKTITTTSTKTSSDNGEPKHLTLQIEGGQAGGDTDDNSEVMEYVDENGRRVRRIVKKTITTTSTKTSSDNGEPKHLTLQIEGGQAGSGTDDNSDVMEYVDENGRRVRRIVKKTMTTTSTRITPNNDGPSSVTTETREISSGGHGPEKILINFGGGIPRPSEEHSQLQLQPVIKPTAVQEKEVFLQFGSQPPAKQESHVNADIKRQPFQIRGINMFEGGGNTTITNGSPGGNSTVYQRTVITKTIGSGDGGTKVVEHSTKTFSHGDDHPITVVKKEKSQIDVPDWSEERSSPETKRKNPDMSDISVHLKYPSDDAPKKRDLESSANESRIHPEVAKQDKPVIAMLSLDDVVKQKDKGEEKPAPPQQSVEDEEEEEDEEDDEEVDEFEEEIVIMEVRRKPRFHKALEIPKPEPEKTGIPIEDLLELTTFEVGQESAPDENLIDEQVEFEERPQTVYEAPNFEEFFKD